MHTNTELRFHVIPDQRIDAEASLHLLGAIKTLLRQGAHRLVIDFRNVQQLDSLGVAVLARVMRQVPPEAQIAVTGLHGQVATIARVTRLHELFANRRFRERGRANPGSLSGAEPC